MNLVTLITGIVIAMAVVELLLQGMPNLKRDLFYLAMLVAWVGFTAKYYYGPDIATYVPQYGELGSVADFVRGKYPPGYEVGYLFFATLCKSLGMTFWGMTAVISTLFFYAVFIVLRRLRDKRVLALALVIVIMKDLIFAQFRQCLAVSFFVFAIVEMERWRMGGRSKDGNLVAAVLLALVAMTMHKSGTFIVGLTAIYYLLQRSTMWKNTWSILLVILVLMMIIPTWDIIEAIVKALHLGSATMFSIKLHLSYMRMAQTNLLIYGTVLIVLALYAQRQTGRNAVVTTAAAGMIIIVIMYQYYYMVDRLRSYFVIFVVYYAFNVMRDAADQRAPFVGLVRQCCEVALMLFLVGKTYSFDKNMRLENGDLYDSCTVFNLIYEDAAVVQQRQMDKAQRFWDSDLRSDSRFAIPDKK